MSIDYRIYAATNNLYCLEGVKKLFQNAIECNVFFLNYNISQYGPRPFLTAEQIANELLSTKPDELYQSFVAQYDDIAFEIRVNTTDKGFLEITLRPIKPRWEKNFASPDNNYFLYFDYARYLRLLLHICCDFTIKNLKAESTYNCDYPINYNNTEIYVDISFNSTLMEGLEKLDKRFKSHKIELFEAESFEKKYTFSSQLIFETLTDNLPFIVFAKTPLIPFKNDIYLYFKLVLELQTTAKGPEAPILKMYPCKPYYVRKGFQEEKASLDLGAYLQYALILSDNYLIWELGANSVL